MTEKDLIKQLQELKEIKPRKDWVLLTKRQLFPEIEVAGRPMSNAFALFQWKLAFAPVMSVLVIIGLFGFSNNTMPGDLLFPVKRAAENAQLGLSFEGEKSGVYLRLANKRLEELNTIAEANKVKSLSPAIKEFQNNISEAADELAAADPEALKELASETKKLEDNKQKLEGILGIQIGEEEIGKWEKQLAQYLITDLEKRTLADSDGALLGEVKELFESGVYTLALEKLWVLSNK